ncbi:MAG: class II holin family protein [Symbiopectobacterium sp.]|uniref:class II holin family protein n=1 Tax=Symbiopectobacterium sp. TaxID=2952789 RepID=UPI0039ED9A3A
MRMYKLTTGIFYGASGASGGYWMLQLLDAVSPNQWTAIGVMGSLLFGLLTFLVNLFFKIREDRRREEGMNDE